VRLGVLSVGVGGAGCVGVCVWVGGGIVSVVGRDGVCREGCVEGEMRGGVQEGVERRETHNQIRFQQPDSGRAGRR